MKTDEEIGALAADFARSETIKLLKKGGPSLEKILKRLDAALDAKETKAKHDRGSGKWKYSKQLIDNATRLRAVQVGLDLHDAMPSQRIDVAVKEVPKFEAVIKMIQKAKE